MNLNQAIANLNLAVINEGDISHWLHIVGVLADREYAPVAATYRRLAQTVESTPKNGIEDIEECYITKDNNEQIRIWGYRSNYAWHVTECRIRLDENRQERKAHARHVDRKRAARRAAKCAD